uniref:Tetratricopeptide repeat domain 34 n=1 Tax=Varanus komodoensis TaxID=61221 RepID=A0A8D2J977_VARKO
MVAVSSKEQATWLCEEGDRQLAAKELPLATAFYMAAFTLSAPVAVKKVACLGKESGAKVVSTLERWCRGESPIPKVQYGSLKAPSLSVGIAAIFLSTLNPNNVAASLHKMEALLQRGRLEEVVSRCNTLLHTHYCIELLLTRALALVLLQVCFQDGVLDYLHAFAKHRDEALKFISHRQTRHLPQIVQAVLDFISLRGEGHCCRGPENWPSDCYDFLVAIAPDDFHVRQAQAGHLLEEHKYKECVSIYSKALEALSANATSWDERASALLMGRAAAYFFLGGKVTELLQDLRDAVEVSPSLATRQFEEIFSAQDVRKIEQHARAALDVEFGAYREAIRTRPDVRRDDGKELLSKVAHTLNLLIQISPSARRELHVRLADCYLLQGNIKHSVDLCNHLLDSEPETYGNTLLTLRGFCHLHAKNCKEALRDFQKVLEHSSPHPSSCVKALCGRGMIRAWGRNPYLTALDYITACQLRSEETHFVIKAYIPWNQRGFLLIILQEEMQKILERDCNGAGSARWRETAKDASGVHRLASLLLDLDATDEVSRTLCADALYLMDRVDEAHKVLLVALSKTSQRAAILSRLALLQLKKGFLYDCNQLLRKLIQTGETSSFLTVMKILREEDRALMQHHCHSRAATILKNKQGEGYIKEAILYLSFAIAAGGCDTESLLTRARCYGHLGQKKTAMFDFNAVLKISPANVQALCGRGFIHLALNQKKEAVHDVILALQADPVLATAEILALKPEAQSRIRQWLFDHCKKVLLEFGTSKEPSPGGILKDLVVVGESLVKMDHKATKSHILYVDVLAADGEPEEALTYLQEALGQHGPNDAISSRFGMLQAKERNMNVAAHTLASLAAKDFQELGYLLNFLDTKQRQSLAQVAAKEGHVLGKEHHHTEALGYYSLAVLASNSDIRYLRKRAACLAQLKGYKQALKDMSKVVQNHGTDGLRTQVEDYCFQGKMYLSISEEELAVTQYIKAFQMELSSALARIHPGPNRDRLSKAFLQTAQFYLAENRYEEAWKTTEYGLLIDQTNPKLKKLKTRIKREASGCRVQ